MPQQLIARLGAEGLHWWSADVQAQRDEPDGSFDSQALLARLGDGDTLTLAVPGEHVGLRQVTTATAERRYLDDSLPYLLEEELAADVDTLHFVHAPAGAERVAVALAGRGRVEQWLEELASCEVEAERVIPEPLLLPLVQGGICVVLERGRAIVRTGMYSGFAVEDQLLAAALAMHIEQLEEPPLQLLVYGGEESDVAAFVPEGLRGLVSWHRGNFVTASQHCSDPGEQLNLLQGQFKPRLPWGDWWRAWRIAAVLATAAVALQIVGMALDVSRLEDRNLDLRRAMEASYRSVNPTGAVLDPEKSLGNQLATLQGSSGGPGFVALLQQFGGAVAGQSGIELESLNFSDRNGDLRVNLRAGDYQSVDRLRAELEQSGLEAVLQNSSAQGSGVRARLLVKAG